MNEREISSLKKKLQEKREELLKIVANNVPEIDGAEIGDEADIASNSLEKEIAFELNDNERVMLDNIESSLTKIEKGIYGICEACRKKISVERLKAMPFARNCIDCQSKNEKK